LKISKFWKSSASFSLLTLISRVFGYVRDLIFTNYLGAGSIHDIFVVIFKIPNVFRSFFGEGALSQSLTPSIIEARTRTTKFLNQVFTILFISLVLFILIVETFPQFFVNIFAPGFSANEQKFDEAVGFLRLVFPYILLISIVAFFGAIQNSKKYFNVVAATPILFNLSLIAFALSNNQLTLHVIGISILCAGIIQLVINALFTMKLSYLPELDFNFDKKLLSSFFSRLLPAVFAAGIYQLNVLVDTIFASFLSTGSPTWLYLSDRLIQFPMGMFGVAIALVALPDITELYIKKDNKNFNKTFLRGSLSTLLLGLATMIFYLIFSAEIISLLFKRGEFQEFDVTMTSASLVAYAYALPFLLNSKFFNSIFFATSKTKFVLVLGIVSLLINLFLNYLFIFIFGMGHVGLALATTCAASIVWLLSIIFLIYLRKSLV
jgi:putative peptidoglycan lipid II flippase